MNIEAILDEPITGPPAVPGVTVRIELESLKPILEWQCRDHGELDRLLDWLRQEVCGELWVLIARAVALAEDEARA